LDSCETRKAIRQGIDIGGINRADVADFLIKQAEKQTELKKYIAISEK